MNTTAPPLPHRGHGHTAMDWDQARTLAHRLPAPLGVQDVALAAAAGRAVAEPLVASAAPPGFDNAHAAPREWYFFDAVVVERRRSAVDPGLADIAVEAVVDPEEPAYLADQPSASAELTLLSFDDAPLEPQPGFGLR